MNPSLINNPLVRRSGWNKELFYPELVPCGICGFELKVTTPVNVKSETGVVTQNPLGFSEDHITPQSKGGGHEIENLQAVHIFCNESRGNRDLTKERIIAIQVRIKLFIDNPEMQITTADSNIFLCKTCNKECYAENARLVRYSKKYCSDECRVEALKTSVKTLCKECLKFFTETPSRLSAGKGLYCSRKCYAKSTGGIERECTKCSNSYYTSKSNNRRSVLLYCSTCRKTS